MTILLNFYVPTAFKDYFNGKTVTSAPEASADCAGAENENDTITGLTMIKKTMKSETHSGVGAQDKSSN